MNYFKHHPSFLILLLLIPCLHLNAQNLFGTPQLLSVKQLSPDKTATMDIDGDGDLDVFSHSYLSPELIWTEQLNEGFRYHIIEKDYVQYHQVEFTDLDTDGDPDIVLSNQFSGLTQISWYENDGHGRFSDLQPLFDSPNSVIQFAIGDLDGDNDMDFVIASSLSDQIGWYENDDNLSFESYHSISTIEENISRIFLFDLDQDGDLDPVYKHGPHLEWFANGGSLGFGEPHYIGSIGDFSHIDTLDFDLDGDIDLCTASTGTNASFDKVYLYENLVFGESFQKHTIASLYGATGIVAADVDQDGYKDIIASSRRNSTWWDGGNTYWYRNNSSSGQSFGPGILIADMGNDSRSVGKGDFNNDDLTDIITSGSNGMTLHWNEGGGDFRLEYLCSGRFNVSSIEVGDINNDHLNDLLICSRHEPNFKYFFNQNNSVSPFKQFKNFNSIGSTIDGKLADINQDGYLDIIAGQFSHRIYGFLFSPTEGVYDETEIYITNADYPAPLTVTKINADQYPDIVYYDGVKLVVKYSTNMGLQYSYNSQFYFSPGMTAVHCVEINHDGLKDFIFSSDEGVLWSPNESESPGAAQIISLDDRAGATDVQYGYLNDDEFLDFAAAFPSINQVVIYLTNNDPISFDTLVLSDEMDGALSVSIADMDGDGDSDIVAGGTTNIVWFEHLDTGNFSPQEIIMDGVKGNFNLLQTKDINGDLLADVIFASTTEDIVGYLINNTEGVPITGNCYYDINENGLRENNEPFLGGQRISTSPNNNATFTNNEGDFVFIMEDGNYEIEYQGSVHWETTTNNSFEVNLPEDQGIVFSFGLRPSSIIDFLKPSIMTGLNRCFSSTPFWLSLRNTGNQVNDGLIRLELPENVSMNSSDQPIDSIVNQSLYWSFESILPGENKTISGYLQMPDQTATGDSLVYLSQAFLVRGTGETSFTNESSFKQVVRCSYDPNDKLINPDRGEPGYDIFAGETLTYTIRFQNTGNDTAFNIVLLDQLASYLNPNTFQPIAASHPYRLNINDNGLMSCYFNNINLLDSTCCWAESQGFLQFEIEPYNDISLGTVVQNTAEIYFDFNPPIYTNTTTNTIIGVSSIVNQHQFPEKISVNISPNPSSHGFQLNVKNIEADGSYFISIINTLGSVIYQSKLSATDLQTYYIASEKFAPGTLFLQIHESDSERILYKGVLIKHQ